MIIPDNRVPTIHVQASATKICNGNNVSFTASVDNGSPNDVYQWTVNGTNVGSGRTVYQTNILKNQDAVACRLLSSSNTICNINNSLNSEPIIITVTQPVDPTISISTPNASICKGSLVVFKAVTTGTGINNGYQWTKNGTPVGTGITFSTSDLSDQDIVSCMLTADPGQGCLLSSTAISNDLVMQVSKDPLPTVEIDVNKRSLCSGDTVLFEATTTPSGLNPIYQWRLNGADAGGNQPTFIQNNFSNGDQVSCMIRTPNAACVSNQSLLSNIIQLDVENLPQIEFSDSVIFIQTGQQATWTTTVDGNISSFQWSPAENLTDPQDLNALTVPLRASTNFKLQVVSTTGCKNSSVVAVKIIFTPSMPNAFTPDGTSNTVFRIPPANTFQLYEFSIFNRWGNLVFSTSANTKGWDGQYNGHASPAGTYVYMIRGQNAGKDILLKGTFILIR